MKLKILLATLALLIVGSSLSSASPQEQIIYSGLYGYNTINMNSNCMQSGQGETTLFNRRGCTFNANIAVQTDVLRLERVAFYYKTRNGPWQFLRKASNGLECRAVLAPGIQPGVPRANYTCNFRLPFQAAEGLTFRASVNRAVAQCGNIWTPTPNEATCGDTYDIPFRIAR